MYINLKYVVMFHLHSPFTCDHCIYKWPQKGKKVVTINVNGLKNV